jgi:hypothetical protein
MKRVLVISGIVLAGLLLLAFLFISPITKYVIERNSEAWTGRKIRIESLWINLFGGAAHLKGFRMLEQHSDSTFLFIPEISCNVSVHQLLSGRYVVESLSLTRPEITITQQGNHFNFDDLAEQFATPDTRASDKEEPIEYAIEAYAVNDAVLHYHNHRPATTIDLTGIYLSGPPITHLDSIYRFLCQFDLRAGGQVYSYLNVQPRSGGYGLILKMRSLNLSFLLPYLREYMKVQSLDGRLSANLLLAGRTDKSTHVFLKGTLTADNFSLVDTTGEKLAAFKRLFVDVDSISTPHALYEFNALELTSPFLRFGMYPDGYNFDRILTAQATDTSTAPMEDYSNVFQMMAAYIRDLSTNYLLKSYRADQLQLTDGHIIFTDYTLDDKFHYDLDSMSLSSENFNSRNDRILISLASRLNRSGVLKGTLSVNPDGYADMDIDYSIHGLQISDINPYSKYYVATPFLDGIIEYTNTTSILNNRMKSTNKLFIRHIIVGTKVPSKTAYHLPVKLAVAILRDPKGNIDLEIPVEGDLKDPHYHFGKVIWQILKNLVVKAATAPYKLLAGAFGGREEDYKEVRFEYQQQGLTEDQQRILDNLAKVVQGKPGVKIEFVQVSNREDDAEQLAVYRAKKDFLGFTADSLSQEQFSQLQELSVRDTLFNAWIDGKLGGRSGLTAAETRCLQYAGADNIRGEIAGFMNLRNERLMQYMMSRGVGAERLNIHNCTEENQAQKGSNPKFLVNFFTNDGPSSSEAATQTPETKTE